MVLQVVSLSSNTSYTVRGYAYCGALHPAEYTPVKRLVVRRLTSFRSHITKCHQRVMLYVVIIRDYCMRLLKTCMQLHAVSVIMKSQAALAVRGAWGGL